MPLQSDVGAFRLISKRHIIFVETQQTDQEISRLTPQEQTHTRVSELLNDPCQFQAVYRQGTKFIFNRDLVIYANAG
jgi:hypothetical protein